MRYEFGTIYCEMFTTNKIWSGVHWAVRAKLKNQIRENFTDSQLANIAPFDKPVCLSFTPLVPKGKRMLDTSNYSAMIKAVEDVLVEHGVFVDDSNKYVRDVLIRPAQRAHDTGFLVQILETDQFQIDGLQF